MGDSLLDLCATVECLKSIMVTKKPTQIKRSEERQNWMQTRRCTKEQTAYFSEMILVSEEDNAVG